MSTENQKATNISLRITPNTPTVQAFGLPPLLETPFQNGDFIGSVEKGGPVNCNILRIAPHGNGTHTESVRHILADGPCVCDVVPLVAIRARLITLSPVSLGDTSERYLAGEPGDMVFTESRLKLKLKDFQAEALIIRSSGNIDKKSINYTATNPAFFTTECMSLIAEKVEHLIVDIPSVDREVDHGLLLNHRLFWNVEVGESAVRSDVLVDRSITEMAYIPPQVRDGEYWCSIAVPNIATDALPSRVVIWKV